MCATEIKLNGDIQRYIWSVILEAAQDEESPTWSTRVLAVRNRTLSITQQSAPDFIAALTWFSNLADDEVEHGEDADGMNQREIKCANNVIERIMKIARQNN